MPFDRLTAVSAAVLAFAGVSATAQTESQTETQPAEASAPAENLPDGFSVLEKHIEASGGAEAGLALEGFRMSGSFTMPAMGMNASITISFQDPSKQVIEVNLGAMGSVIQGTDGTVAWASPQPGMEPSIVEGPEAETLLAQGRFKDRYTPRELYTEATTVGTEEHDGEKYYRVELTDKDGQETVGLYSVRTGLQHKEMTRIAPNAPTFASEVTFTDYRSVGGMTFPFKMLISQGPMEQVVQFTEIEVNPDFADGTFDPPGSM